MNGYDRKEFMSWIGKSLLVVLTMLTENRRIHRSESCVCLLCSNDGGAKEHFEPCNLTAAAHQNT